MGKIRKCSSAGLLEVRVCYSRLEREPVGGSCLLQPAEASHSLTLILMGDSSQSGKSAWLAASNLTDSWSAVRITLWCRHWAQQAEGKHCWTWCTPGVTTGGGQGCSDHALLELVISRNAGLAGSKGRSLNFRRASCRLFQEFLDEILWTTVCRGKGMEKSWSLSQKKTCSELKSSPSLPHEIKQRR